MSDQSSIKNSTILEKLARLYELRQIRARRQYRQPQTSLAIAQAHVELREQDYRAVPIDADKLNLAETSESPVPNLRAQQQIHIKRHLKRHRLKKAYSQSNSEPDSGRSVCFVVVDQLEPEEVLYRKRVVRALADFS